jgi:hypothetical protein
MGAFAIESPDMAPLLLRKEEAERCRFGTVLRREGCETRSAAQAVHTAEQIV